MIKPKLRMRLGDLLVAERIIDDSQLQHALAHQRQQGRKLGQCLIELGYLQEKQLLEFLAQQLKVPVVDLSHKRLDAGTVQLLPEILARRYRALVLEDHGDRVVVGMSDPADLTSLDAISMRLAPRQVELAAVLESQLMKAFEVNYRRSQEIASFAEQLQEEVNQSQDELDLGIDLSGDDENAAPVARLLRTVFEDAVQIGASDIHIEPDEHVLRIRLRVDGVLQESVLKEQAIVPALVLRLKLLAGLDISEKRLPQDGRFNFKVQGRSMDVRLSTMPVQYGEAVVMRLLDQTAGLRTLAQTGMPEHLLQRLRMQIRRPHGLILVTGPTGSGKTTTLYGALGELNTPGRKIITVEDPVEYRLPRINQVQVNPKVGLSFARVLRTTLRQDPDIVLVGETRDEETAEIGLRAAMTGHLVLTTLHTNDAISSAIRLVDMGVRSYLVASALRAVVAQRLIRQNCPDCAAPVKLEPFEYSWLQSLSEQDLSQRTFMQGQGCQSCNHTGYKGRIAVFEMLELNEQMRDALRQERQDLFAQQARASRHFQPLAVTALSHALDGVTSPEEVLRLIDTLDDSLDLSPQAEQPVSDAELVDAV